MYYKFLPRSSCTRLHCTNRPAVIINPSYKLSKTSQVANVALLVTKNFSLRSWRDFARECICFVFARDGIWRLRRRSPAHASRQLRRLEKFVTKIRFLS